MTGILTGIITASDPQERDRSLDCLVPDGVARRAAGRVRRAGGVPARQRQPLRAGPGHVLSARHPPVPSPRPSPTARPAATSPLTATRTCWRVASRRPCACSCARRSSNGPSDALSQRPRRRVPPARLPDAGRSGAPLRALRARQPVDVPPGPPRRPAAARPPGAARHRRRGAFPILQERTPVRMDLTHSAWSDIFFLGMDYPEGARVLNVSIDLAVRGPGAASPRPPVEAYLRVIDEPLLRLASVDLGASADITSSGRSLRLRPRLSRTAEGGPDRVGPGAAGHGGRGAAPDGPAGPTGRAGARAGTDLQRQRHPERLAPGRLHQPAGVADRRLHAGDGADPEPDRAAGRRRAAPGRRPRHPGRVAGRVRRRLAGLRGRLARHQADPGRRPPPRATRSGASAGAACCRAITSWATPRPRTRPGRSCRTAWCWSTAAWRRTSARSWRWSRRSICCARRPSGSRRQDAQRVLDETFWAICERGDIRSLGDHTTRNFFGPIQSIIPWASNLYTETLIRETRAQFGGDFWGFWMLGGMAGGGMGFIFDPAAQG